MNVQVYAQKIKVDAERDSMNVYLEGVDLDQLVGEFSTKDLLDAISVKNFSDIVEYIAKVED